VNLVFLVSWWCIRKGLSTDDSPAAAVRYGQMGKFLPDPEIDKLVQEMNRLVERDAETVGDGSHSIRDLDDPSLRVVDMGEGIGELLGEMVRRGASDLILVPGAQPVVRVEGRLERLSGEVVEEGVRSLFAPHLGDRARRSLTDSGSADFSISPAILRRCCEKSNLHSSPLRVGDSTARWRGPTGLLTLSMKLYGWSIRRRLWRPFTGGETLFTPPRWRRRQAAIRWSSSSSKTRG